MVLCPDRYGIALTANVIKIGVAHLPLTLELVAGETPRRHDNLLRIRAAAREPGSARGGGSPPGRRRGAGCLFRFRDVVPRDIHGTALRLEIGDRRPYLLGGELPRHDGHDRLVARYHIGRRVRERLVEVLLAALARP